MRHICENAYRESVGLARKKSAFPLFGPEQYTQSAFLKNLPENLMEDIRCFGIRTSHLTAIAPRRTISLLANNVSSGLERVYQLEYQRRLRCLDGSLETCNVAELGLHAVRSCKGKAAPLPAALATVEQVAPERQLAMQTVLHRYVDNAISKTINVPAEISFDSFSSIYEHAYDLGLKGCTTFRPSDVTESILLAADST